MEKCTTFWQSKANPDLIRVLYVSPTSWSKTMMADINRTNQQVSLYSGDTESSKEIICKFSQDRFFGLGDYRQMSQNGYDRFILDEVIEIIDANNEIHKYSVLKNHIISELCYDYSYVDATKYSLNSIKERIDFIFESRYTPNELKNSFYCGITNDLDIRMQQHREKDFEIVNDKVYAWICATALVAAEVEKLAGDAGYDIGATNNMGNGGEEDSVIVYLLKKGKLVTKK